LRVSEDVIFSPGCINLIVGAIYHICLFRYDSELGSGPTGSGKTALLHALLGEMHLLPESARSWVNLPRDCGIAYAAQESWVLNDTIRNNIVFGSDFDEARYKKGMGCSVARTMLIRSDTVLWQCALEHDLSLFHAGDETEVGEKGLTLRFVLELNPT
jgi:hypothetical protein